MSQWLVTEECQELGELMRVDAVLERMLENCQFEVSCPLPR